MYFPMDWTMIILIPAVILSIYAQIRVKTTYNKYSEIQSSSGITAARIARNLLDANGLRTVNIAPIAGELTDNYNPIDRTLHLSEGVYDSSSVAAIGIVAHEVGHAVQDAVSYAPMKIRSRIVPVSSIGSSLSIPLFFIGILMSYGPLMDAGIILFSLAVLFTIITLPVEFNASNRAAVMLSASGYLSSEEVGMAKKVLNAAALTYVAATAMAVLQLLRLIMLRNARND